MDAPATIRWSSHSAVKQANEAEAEGEIATLTASGTSVSLGAGIPDEVLMAQLGEGNREALGILFGRYARAVRSIAYRSVHDAPEADDLVQDIFLHVHRHARAFDSSKGTARNWIFQLAHRRAISRHRYLHSRHFYEHVVLDDLADEQGGSQRAVGQPQNAIDEMFGEVSFQRVFRQLSGDQRETLRLHFFEGYSLAEIAVKLGQSRGNIKHHYFRGLERLRKKLFSGKLQGHRTVW